MNNSLILNLFSFLIYCLITIYLPKAQTDFCTYKPMSSVFSLSDNLYFKFREYGKDFFARIKLTEEIPLNIDRYIRRDDKFTEFVWKNTFFCE